MANGAQPVLCSGRAVRGFTIEAITVHHESLPQPIAAVTANAIATYKLPDTRRQYLPRLRGNFTQSINGGIREVREMYSDGSRGDFQVAPDGKFTFAVPLPDGPGIYTVVVWVHRHGTSGDAIPASNVSIKVDRPAGTLVSGTR
jgi:hypothetical protein